VFADTIIDLLKDGRLGVKKSRKGIDFIKKYGWMEIAKTEFEILKTLEE